MEPSQIHPNSVCLGAFPAVRWSEGLRWLYNPYARKRLADRPEERVRLQLAQYLVHCAGFPGSHLIFEAGLSGTTKKGLLRTDVIITDASMKPLILVECKAPPVPLTMDTARQAFIYNQKIQAPFILLTNGVHDLYFDGSRFSYHLLPQLAQKTPLVRNEGFWMDAGFITPEWPAPLRERLAAELNHRLPISGTVILPDSDAPIPHFVVFDGSASDGWLMAWWTDIQSRQRLTLERVLDGQSAGTACFSFHPDGQVAYADLDRPGGDGWQRIAPHHTVHEGSELLLSWDFDRRKSFAATLIGAS
jgi:hypothetical protein